MPETLVTHSVALPSGPLSVLQPRDAADMPDDGPVDWAPIAPYWAVLWRSGIALARELDAPAVRGRRVVELGCGLGVPSIAAARAGAVTLATDASSEALELATRSALLNDVDLETAAVEWAEPGALVERAPFDLVVASDVLYERNSIGRLLSLLPKLAPTAWIADPGRPLAADFLERAEAQWPIETSRDGVVSIHRLTLH